MDKLVWIQKKGAKSRLVTAGILFTALLTVQSHSAPISQETDRLSLNGNLGDLYTDLTLPDKATDGSVISWQSSDTLFLGNDGKINGRFVGENKEITLTATFENGDKQDFKVSIHGYEPYSNYLFAYFPANNNENIYYALSNDGYNFTAMNGGNRVVAADSVSIKKGLRDPHVLRAPDGWFYMVNTDMKSAEGWSSNRGMVLMRSRNLISWEHSTVHFPDKYKGKNFANVTRVWAPETFWDDTYDNGDGTKGRPLVYFSLLTNDGTIPYDKVFYAYANRDFTDLEGEPVHFFDRGRSTIDMDIVYNRADGLYHAFYKNEGDGGICKVTAETLLPKSGSATGSQWSKPSGALQQTTEAVEGAGVFKLINQESWILMYDCYNNGHYQFTSSADLNTFKFVQNTEMKGAFTPRHGTVLPITAEETEKLMRAFPTEGFEPKVIDIPDSVGVCDGKKVVGPCSGTKIIPYVKVDDGGWEETLDLKVAKGATVQFGPHPWDGKIWSWKGPDGFSATVRETKIENMDGTNSGIYTVEYTNETGCRSVAKIKIVVDDPDKPYVEPDTSTIDTGRTGIAGRNAHDPKFAGMVVRTEYFSVNGQILKARPREQGVYIRKEILDNGMSRVSKINIR